MANFLDRVDEALGSKSLVEATIEFGDVPIRGRPGNPGLRELEDICTDAGISLSNVDVRNAGYEAYVTIKYNGRSQAQRLYDGLIDGYMGGEDPADSGFYSGADEDDWKDLRRAAGR